MPMRLLPSMVPVQPVFRTLAKELFASLKTDLTWFILLWRLKPHYPPSRA